MSRSWPYRGHWSICPLQFAKRVPSVCCSIRAGFRRSERIDTYRWPSVWMQAMTSIPLLVGRSRSISIHADRTWTNDPSLTSLLSAGSHLQRVRIVINLAQLGFRVRSTEISCGRERSQGLQVTGNGARGITPSHRRKARPEWRTCLRSRADIRTCPRKPGCSVSPDSMKLDTYLKHV